MVHVTVRTILVVKYITVHTVCHVHLFVHVHVRSHVHVHVRYVYLKVLSWYCSMLPCQYTGKRASRSVLVVANP